MNKSCPRINFFQTCIQPSTPTLRQRLRSLIGDIKEIVIKAPLRKIVLSMWDSSELHQHPRWARRIWSSIGLYVVYFTKIEIPEFGYWSEPLIQQDFVHGWISRRFFIARDMTLLQKFNYDLREVMCTNLLYV